MGFSAKQVQALRRQPKRSHIRTFETGLAKTVQWFLQNRTWWQKILTRGYKAERIGILENS